MATFYLKVLTADKDIFEGKVDSFIIRTTAGDVGVHKGHINYVAPIGVGALIITQGDVKRIAAVSRGFLDVRQDGTTIIARTCEWVEEIDLNRAQEALKVGEKMLSVAKTAQDKRVANLKVRKAQNRIRLSQQ